MEVSWEDWKKTKDGLCEMHLENFSFAKEYMKSVEESYSIAHDATDLLKTSLFDQIKEDEKPYFFLF